MDKADYAFRAVTRDDLPLLHSWLGTPEVMLWWGEPRQEAALLDEDIDNPRMVMRIVSLNGHPFAYAQDYAVESWPQAHFAGLPRGARAIDSFIGEPGMIGQGHGGRYLRILAERLRREGAPAVVIDPDADNFRARRAYARAGFRGEEIFETESGPAVLMIFAD